MKPQVWHTLVVRLWRDRGRSQNPVPVQPIRTAPSGRDARDERRVGDAPFSSSGCAPPTPRTTPPGGRGCRGRLHQDEQRWRNDHADVATTVGQRPRRQRAPSVIWSRGRHGARRRTEGAVMTTLDTEVPIFSGGGLTGFEVQRARRPGIRTRCPRVPLRLWRSRLRTSRDKPSKRTKRSSPSSRTRGSTSRSSRWSARSPAGT